LQKTSKETRTIYSLLINAYNIAISWKESDGVSNYISVNGLFNVAFSIGGNIELSGPYF